MATDSLWSGELIYLKNSSPGDLADLGYFRLSV